MCWCIKYQARITVIAGYIDESTTAISRRVSCLANRKPQFPPASRTPAAISTGSAAGRMRFFRANKIMQAVRTDTAFAIASGKNNEPAGILLRQIKNIAKQVPANNANVKSRRRNSKLPEPVRLTNQIPITPRQSPSRRSQRGSPSEKALNTTGIEAPRTAAVGDTIAALPFRQTLIQGS